MKSISWLLLGVMGLASTLHAAKIGIVGPLTGPLAAEFSMVLEPIKAKLLASDIELLVLDDECRRDLAQVAADRLVQEEVQAVVGHYCSAATLSALPLYQQANIPVFSTHATHHKVSEFGYEQFYLMRPHEYEWLEAIQNEIETVSIDDPVAVFFAGEGIEKRLGLELVNRLGERALVNPEIDSLTAGALQVVNFGEASGLEPLFEREEISGVVYSVDKHSLAERWRVVQLALAPWSREFDDMIELADRVSLMVISNYQ